MKVWSKYWQDPEHATLLNEDVWFRVNQELLLRVANTDVGRDLLCIDKGPPVVRVLKNAVTFYLGQRNGRHVYQTDFRVGAKWANVIRTRWSEFNSLARYFRSDGLGVLLSPLARYALTVSADTTTVYPNPDPETKTFDGAVIRSMGNPGETWATIRGGPATGLVDNNSTGFDVYVIAATTTDQWRYLGRAMYLFDTSSINDGDTIDAATLSLFGGTANGGKQTGISTWSLSIVSSNPASNTGIALSDWGNFGSTRFASDKAQASWANGSYNNFALNSSGLAAVSKTGVSKFGCIFAQDLDNTQPTWVSGQGGGPDAVYAEASGTTQDPKLVVTHTAGAAPAANHQFFQFF